MRRSFAWIAVAILSLSCSSLDSQRAPFEVYRGELPEGFTRQQLLRGSITPERAWWDLRHYALDLEVLPEQKRIRGSNTIRFTALAPGARMQVDLQEPLAVTRVLYGDRELAFEREGKVYWIDFPERLERGAQASVQVFYEGVPVESKRPPWSGGFSWNKDDKGRAFIATTCQGIGASLWWPCKDHGLDEPDEGMDVRVTVPESLVAVSNGRLVRQEHDEAAKTKSYLWRVVNPINNYAVNVNIGHYVRIPGSYDGEGGKLDLEYWVLDHQVEIASKQFQEVPRTLAAFEHWFGKYPWYQDSYKLVVVPYLGMEHQSSVTYGNGFQNGYRGRDLSLTGVGMKFDFIVVHETAHEWWGNNVSMRDAADMWIHESFANYAENLFVEHHFGKEDGAKYVIGCRKLVRNRAPIVGTYHVNASGSGDMYYKGGNMLHTMRQIVNDDAKWRGVLRGIQKEFWHRTITGAELERYVSAQTGFDFGKFFDQYLRGTEIPVLRHELRDGVLRVWWDKVVPGFRIPVVLEINGEKRRVVVGEQATELELDGELRSFGVDENFYVRLAS